ncbi:MAG: transposase [Candidatus Binatia bacterium]
MDRKEDRDGKHTEGSGGHRAAILFSLVTTAKRLEIEPQPYLADVIARIGSHKMSRIGELTPCGWKEGRA